MQVHLTFVVVVVVVVVVVSVRGCGSSWEQQACTFVVVTIVIAKAATPTIVINAFAELSRYFIQLTRKVQERFQRIVQKPKKECSLCVSK